MGVAVWILFPSTIFFFTCRVPQLFSPPDAPRANELAALAALIHGPSGSRGRIEKICRTRQEKKTYGHTIFYKKNGLFSSLLAVSWPQKCHVGARMCARGSISGPRDGHETKITPNREIWTLESAGRRWIPGSAVPGIQFCRAEPAPNLSIWHYLADFFFNSFARSIFFPSLRLLPKLRSRHYVWLALAR